MSKPLTKEIFIERARKIHGDKYDYSKVEYIDNKTKVCIICPIHGEFWQRPYEHWHGKGCKKCANEIIGNTLRKTTEQFIKDAKKVHSDKYDYSKVEYKGAHTKVCIICPKHGEFWQTAGSHLQGQGCLECAKEMSSLSKIQGLEGFKKKVKDKYGNKFILVEETYKDSKTKMCIICPKHGEFWITPNNFLRGHNCPRCKNSLLENELSSFLNKNRINFYTRVNKETFPWIGRQHLDFYLPDYNVAIECQGGQHFKPVNIFGGKDEFTKRRLLDEKKLNLCQNNGITLLYFASKKEPDMFLNKIVFQDKNKLLEAIINGTN